MIALTRIAALMLIGGFGRATAVAQSSQLQTSVDTRGPVSVGFYYGELYKKTYLSALYAPQAMDLSSTQVLAANFDFRLYRSSVVPLQFAVELDADRHFGEAHQYEVVLAPVIRWTAFPWNRYLYTNVSASVLGVSYATGVSAWERQNSGQNRGSNFLQFGALELAVSRRSDSRTEFFMRLHHRSGIYGLINGVDGGSSYLAVGIRLFH